MNGHVNKWSMFYHPIHPFRDSWLHMFRLYRRTYGKPIRGSSRIVFKNGDSVYKLPLNQWGLEGNQRELCLAMVDPAKYAYCWPHEVYNGILIIGMEWIDHAEGLPPVGWWADIDGMQVGYNKHGLLRAYDFALS